MSDADIGKVIFVLLETVDELASVPAEKLRNDLPVLKGAMLGLFLLVQTIEQECETHETFSATVN